MKKIMLPLWVESHAHEHAHNHANSVKGHAEDSERYRKAYEQAFKEFCLEYYQHSLIPAETEDSVRGNPGARGDWEKEGYIISHEIDGNTITVTAKKNGEIAGELYARAAVGNLKALNLEVKPQHRRKGLATALYQRAEEVMGIKFVRGTQSSDAKKLWSQPNRPFGKSKRNPAEVNKKFKAIVHYPDGESVETKAEKKGGTWFIGGDLASGITKLGGKIFIESDGKIYWLKGNRLVFQDYVKDN